MYAFLRRHRLAVISTVNPAASPQASLIGIAVTEALEIIFDTVSTSRKFASLLADPRVTLFEISRSVVLANARTHNHECPCRAKLGPRLCQQQASVASR
jgi:hypothetical protein